MHTQQLLRKNPSAIWSIAFGMILSMISCSQPHTGSTESTGASSAPQNGELQVMAPIYYKIDTISDATTVEGKLLSKKLAFHLILKTQNGSSESGPSISSRVDSITWTTSAVSEGRYMVDSVKQITDIVFDFCGLKPAIKQHSHVSVPGRKMSIPMTLHIPKDACNSDGLIVGGGLIVIVIDSLPDKDGFIAIEDLRVWKDGAALPLEKLDLK
jgi:hypothetical protein